ncbi:MAG: hypothetical protein JWR05_2280 [Mucilaginibacter sp.]|nr:hypothetical protein [Mucilaginibacter sp.]
MKRVKSLVFHKINFLNLESPKTTLLETMLSINFEENLGYGFTSVDFSENVLSARVIKRTSTFINDYDNSTNEFLRKQIFVFSEFQFFIDFDYNLLYVLGGQSQMNFIKTVLRNTLQMEYQIDEVNLNASQFYELVIEKNIDVQIEQIIINRFNYNNSMVGRFSGHVTNQLIGSELIGSYKSDIVKISFCVKLNDNEQFTLQVLPNGSIKFLSEIDEFDFILDYLKQIIFSKNG